MSLRLTNAINQWAVIVYIHDIDMYSAGILLKPFNCFINYL